MEGWTGLILFIIFMWGLSERLENIQQAIKENTAACQEVRE